MPIYEIKIQERSYSTYTKIVWAKNEAEVKAATDWGQVEDFLVESDVLEDWVESVEQVMDTDFIESLIANNQIEQCPPHEHSWDFVDSCGASVCIECSQHASVNRDTGAIVQSFVRCICGWAQDGGNGRQQLVEMGENLEEDY
jgi:hypothetical protein